MMRAFFDGLHTIYRSGISSPEAMVTAVVEYMAKCGGFDPNKPICISDVDGTLVSNKGRTIVGEAADRLQMTGNFDSEAYYELSNAAIRYANNEMTQDEAAVAFLDTTSRGLAGQEYAEIVSNSTPDTAEMSLYMHYKKGIQELMRRTNVIGVTAGAVSVGYSTYSQKFGIPFIGVPLPVDERGMFTGEKPNFHLTSDVKARIAQELKKYGEIILAMGDSDGDIGLLESAKHALLINPNVSLEQMAIDRNDPKWRVYKGNNFLRAVGAVLKGLNSEDQVTVVNDYGGFISHMNRKDAEKNGLRHLGISNFFRRPDGKFILQRRAKDRKLFPGKWSAVDEHSGPYEDFWYTAVDGGWEEYNINIATEHTRFLGTHVGNYDLGPFVERLYLGVFETITSKPVIMQKSEIECVQEFSLDDVASLVARGETTTWFAEEFNKFYGQRNHV